MNTHVNAEHHLKLTESVTKMVESWQANARDAKYAFLNDPNACIGIKRNYADDAKRKKVNTRYGRKAKNAPWSREGSPSQKLRLLLLSQEVHASAQGVSSQYRPFWRIGRQEGRWRWRGWF